MFIPEKEKEGNVYFEFQFCKVKKPIQKRLFGGIKIKGYRFWEKDSLVIDIEGFDIFSEKYSFLVKKSYTDFNYYGVNYYSKEITKEFIENLKNDKEYKNLVDWLKEALNKYNGFYILGI